MSRLQTLIKKFKEGKIANHLYVSDMGSRDPECSVKGCDWYWEEHLEPKLFKIVKEESYKR